MYYVLYNGNLFDEEIVNNHDEACLVIINYYGKCDPHEVILIDVNEVTDV